MLKPRFYVQRFLNAGESFYGEGCIKALSSIRNVRTLIVTTKSVAHQDYFQTLLGCIKSEDDQILVSPFQGEPKKEEVFRALHVVEEFQPDLILAVGGGSIIDGAKLIWYFYEKGDVQKDIYERPQSPGTLNRIDFYAVPTTCGTGSEVSSSAILSEEKKKIPIVTHDFLPKAFFLDPNFLTSLPLDLKIETVMDAFTHAVEGYVSKIENPMMDVFAVSALRLIGKNLFQSMENPENKEALLQLQMASMLAGLVQNHCMVGLCHSISHAVSGGKIPHGFLNLSIISHVIRQNSRDGETKEKYHRLFSEAGFTGTEQVLEFVASVKGHNSKKLSDYIDGETLVAEETVREILEDKLTGINPVMPGKDEVLDILGKAYAS